MKKVFNTLDSMDKFIFLFDIYMIISMIICWPIIVINNIKPTQLSDKICWLYQHGYFCPGCGGTRAVEQLLYGHFIKSFLYYPLIDIILLFIIISFINYIIYLFTKGNVLLFSVKPSYINYILLIIYVWFVFRNLIAILFNCNIYYLF